MSWFAAWAYRHYRKAPTRESQPENLSQVKLSGSTVVGPVAGRDINIDTFVQQGIDLDTPKDEYHSTPTAADIGTTIRQASLYLQPTVARSYDGLKVRWRAHISDIHTVRNGEASLVVKTGDEWPYVNMRVRLEDGDTVKCGVNRITGAFSRRRYRTLRIPSAVVRPTLPFTQAEMIQACRSIASCLTSSCANSKRRRSRVRDISSGLANQSCTARLVSGSGGFRRCSSWRKLPVAMHTDSGTHSQWSCFSPVCRWNVSPFCSGIKV